MRYLKFFLISLILFTCGLPGCRENPSDTPLFVLVEGSWQGQLNSNTLFITFIEGEFEGSPTVTGSAHLPVDSIYTSLIVMGGTHNKVDSLWFGLYQEDRYEKGLFQMRAKIYPDSLFGIYKKFDEQSHIVESGEWTVKRIP